MEQSTRHVHAPFPDSRLYGRHFPSLIPSKRRRACVVCSIPRDERGQNGAWEQKTRFECKSANCNVALCAAPCFEIYHTHTDYQRAYREMMATQD